MTRKSILVIVTGSLLVSAAALGGEIYKWTDDEGNVHYEDRPVGDDVQRVPIVSRGTNYAAVQARIDARQEHEEARSEALAERQEQARTAAEERAEAEERLALCQKSRERLQKYLQVERLYKMNDAGEREYLDEVQMMEARSDAQKLIQEYCD